MRLRDWHDAVRAADDAAALRLKLMPWSVAPDLLVLTVSALEAARAAVGPGAPPRELLAEVARTQGAACEPGAAWSHPSTADRVLSSVSECLGSATSFGNSARRVVFVNGLRIPREAEILHGLPCPAERLAAGQLLIGLHEVGHVAQGRGTAPEGFDLLPDALPVDGLPVQRPRFLSRWHADECHADAFQAAAACASGMDPSWVAAGMWSHMAVFRSDRMVRRMGEDPFWDRYPLWRGPYATAGAFGRVLAAPPPPGTTLGEVLGIADEAGRAGRLSWDGILEAGLGAAAGRDDGLDEAGWLARFGARLLHPCRIPLPPGRGEGLLGWIADACAAVRGDALFEADALPPAALVEAWEASVLERGGPGAALPAAAGRGR